MDTFHSLWRDGECHEEREPVMAQAKHQKEPAKERREPHFQNSCFMKLEQPQREREEKRVPDKNSIMCISPPS